MNHPNREEWVPYLFGEPTPDVRQRLKAHLQSCAECREEIQSWQRSLARLDSWKLPPAPRAKQAFAPFLRWAAAAALVMAVGFGVGRLTAANADIRKVRAAIEPELRLQLTREFAGMMREEARKAASETSLAAAQRAEEAIASFAVTLENRRAEDNRAILAALDRSESQRLAGWLTLKRDLDTLALNADAGLRQTEQKLFQLADYTQPAARP